MMSVIKWLLLLLIVWGSAIHAENHPYDVLPMGLGDITEITWSADGQALAVSAIGGLWLYDMANLTHPRYFDLPLDKVVRRLAFSPDRQELAGLTEDLHLIRWNLATGEQSTIPPDLLSEYPSLGGGAVAYSSDGVWLAYGQETLVLLNRHTEDSDTIPLQYTLSDLIFSPDNQTLVAFMASWTDADAGSMLVWDINTQSTIFTPDHYLGGIQSGTFSDDGNYIYAFDWAYQAIAWDVSAGYTFDPQPAKLADPTLIPNRDRRVYNPARDTYALYTNGVLTLTSVLSTAHHAQYHLLALSPDERYIAVYDGQNVHLWDQQEGTSHEKLSFQNEMVQKLVFSTDGQLGILMMNGDVYQWSVIDDTITINPPPRPVVNTGSTTELIGYHDLIWDGRSFVVFGCGTDNLGRSNTIFVTNHSQASIVVDQVHYMTAVSCPRTPYISNADGSAGVLIADDNQTMQVIQPEGDIIAEIPHPSASINALALNNDATRLTVAVGNPAMGGGAVDVALTQWILDAVPPQPITFSDETSLGIVQTIIYHPSDDSIVAVAGGDDANVANRIQVWRISADTMQAELLFQSPHLPRAVKALAFMRDGRLISTGDDGLIRVWQIDN